MMAAAEGFEPTVYGTLEQDIAGSVPEVLSIALERAADVCSREVLTPRE